MKTNKNYVLLSIVTALALVGGSLAAFSSAQAVTPVSCSTNTPTVSQNQAAVFTATGGNGSYVWSGTNLSVSNPTGTQFAVSYPNVGVYTITVNSAGFGANCTMTVVAGPVTGALACSPAVQSVVLGQSASVSASGGDGSYTWSSPDVTINNATGSGFSVNYASTGLKVLTVSSAGSSTNCDINVLPNGGTVTPPVTPGLPNTGGGYGH